MPIKSDLISYAMDFSSYLVSKVEGINKIILHGSIARGDSDKLSDIDLFIDTKEKIRKKIDKATSRYYKTKKFREWELKGVTNPISIITGKLDSKEWKDLKRAIINTGVILYGKYKSDIKKTNQYVLFSFENIKPDKKRVLVFRKLFGFKTKNKEYLGLTQKTNSIRLGKGTLLVTIEHANEIKKYFQEKKVKVKLYDLWSDTEFN
jgi:predicted nucleotidyltransferase